MNKATTLLMFSMLFAQVVFGQSYYFDSTYGNYVSDKFFKEDLNTVDYIFESTYGLDSNIYFTGWTGSPNNFIIGSTARDGNTNTKFSSYVKSYAFTNLRTKGHDIVQQTDNKLVVAGLCIRGSNNYSSVFTVRVDDQGNIDTTYGDSGIFIYEPANKDFHVADMVLTDNNEVYVLGRESGNGNHSYFIIKLTDQGQPDSTFSTDGIFTYNTGSSVRYLTKGLIDDDGGVLICGTDTNYQIMKIQMNGNIDSSFGNSGVLKTNQRIEAYAFKKIGATYVVAGKHTSSLDPVTIKFGPSSIQQVNIQAYQMFMQDGFIQDNGNIILAGYYAGFYRIVRLDANGNLDSSFYQGNSDYKQSLSNIVVFTVCEDTDGNLYSGGQGSDLINSGSGQDFFMLKLSKNNTTSNQINSETLKVQLYPNPSSGEIYLAFDKNNRAKWKASIFDVNGRFIKGIDIHGNERTMISLDGVNKGMYYLILESSLGFVTKQIIIQ